MILGPSPGALVKNEVGLWRQVWALGYIVFTALAGLYVTHDDPPAGVAPTASRAFSSCTPLQKGTWSFAGGKTPLADPANARTVDAARLLFTLGFRV